MFEIIYPIIIVASIMITIFTIIYGLIYSHKISGPIYRVKRTIESLTKGIFNFKIQFRKKDKFQDLSGYLNELINYLNEKMLIVRGNNYQMNLQLKKVIGQLKKSSMNKQQIKTLIQDIDKHNYTITQELKEMKLSRMKESTHA